MVELATLQAISYIMGSLGVFLAAIYYIFNMRATHQARKEVNKAQEEQRERDEINKKIQLTNNMLQTLCKLETQQISGELLNYTWNDTQDFLNKYDSSVNPDSFAKRMALFNIFETLGYLLKQEVIDQELIYINGGNSVIFHWAKFKPILEEYRKIAYGSDMFAYFEYFAEEMWRIKHSRDPSFTKDQTLGLDFSAIFNT